MIIGDNKIRKITASNKIATIRSRCSTIHNGHKTSPTLNIKTSRVAPINEINTTSLCLMVPAIWFLFSRALERSRFLNILLAAWTIFESKRCHALNSTIKRKGIILCNFCRSLAECEFLQLLIWYLMFSFCYTFLPISPKMIMATLMPIKTPETCPTVCMNAAGSVDWDATVSMKKKNPAARTLRRTPVRMTRQFLCRIAFALLRWNVSVAKNLVHSNSLTCTLKSCKGSVSNYVLPKGEIRWRDEIKPICRGQLRATQITWKRAAKRPTS